ncbi:uncharacterized protein LOC126769058 [Nymphalis io]|uniref:uncharacterized protein LOC126769058 n=1 Tax=Inachis io TaxID=171585 RepID=UPI002167E448|nr:uncharacterized protein LOC126769058 [Nymphalis io]
MMAKIPKSPRSNCYFGCNAEGPLHHFHKPEKYVERFEIWKAVLENDTTEEGNMYIYNQLRLCNKHFENYCILPSKTRLTRNAIPSLYIKKDDMSICASTSTEKSIETGTAVLMDKATKKSIKQKFFLRMQNLTSGV